MRLARVLLISVLALSIPCAAFAQDDEVAESSSKKKKKKKSSSSSSSKASAVADRSSAAEDEPMPETAATPAAEAEGAAPPAQGQPDASASAQQDRFHIKRGFFAESDLGVFMTFGGVNNLNGASRGVSNVQPHLGVTFGYDVASGDAFNLGLGLRFAMGLSGGAGRPDNSGETDRNVLLTRSNDFSVIEVGLQAGASIMMSERIALTIKADGGAGIIDPDPRPIADDVTAGSSTFAPVFGAGLGIEYYTLLNDFAVGVTMRFQGVLLGGLIPGATVTVPIKYTF